MVDPQAAGIQARRAGAVRRVLGKPTSQIAPRRQWETVQQRIQWRMRGLPRRERRRRGHPRERSAQPQTFPGGKEKCAVATHRTSHSARPLIQTQGRAWVTAGRGKRVIGSELLVAQMVSQRAVPIVRAGARGEPHLRARHASRFGREARRLHADFLQRIQRRQILQSAERSHRWQRAAGELGRGRTARHSGVRAHAVQAEVIRIGALSVDAELAGLSGGSRRGYYPGSQFH